MNTILSEIFSSIMNAPFDNQRRLAETTGYSLGTVNQSLKQLVSEGFLTKNFQPTTKAMEEYRKFVPKNAIILAAGVGMRMAPINLSAPKGLMEVDREPLIERLIKQLHEVQVTDISIVVGFMKESFDYLIDEYGVKLVYNPEYAGKNNLHSLALVADRISDTYIIPSDIWCRTSPFRDHELYSWYMVTDAQTPRSNLRVNRKKELIKISDNEPGNQLTEVAYIRKEDALDIRNKIKGSDSSGEHDNDFWEMTLFEKGKLMLPARIFSQDEFVEIDTYEQLRELDSHSIQLKSRAIDTIAGIFDVAEDQIIDIEVLKKGMTNRSFLFSVKGEKYIMRIPGEGTDQLINREHEAEVYRAISGLGICDDPVYINPENGYKITKFLNNIRVADPFDIADLEKCMARLRSFHEMKLTVEHTFDLFGEIAFYESLWGDKRSIYRDFEQTKKQVFSLKSYIDSQEKDWALTHIDAVPDNFLFYMEDGEEKLQLTDWEYAGMQDPHLDIAMFSVYSGYNKDEIDRLIDIYFKGQCSRETRSKIYGYVAASGLLWSNWCEYKAILGVEFGEYAMKQYRYAKEYSQYAMKEMAKE